MVVMGRVHKEASKPSNSTESPSSPAVTTSTSVTETVNGTHEFKITGYSLSKGIGIGKGYKRFFKRSALETSDYLKDDCLQVHCCVGVVKSHTGGPKIYSIPLPPSDIGQHFGNLLESGTGTDVNFDVDEETFSAHKLVLAARSPVFRAQLYGPMKDQNTQCIKVEDMEAPVFKDMGKNSPRLARVGFNNNSFSGELPPGLCSGYALSNFTAFKNKFSGPLPECFKNCSKLRRIRLEDNQFSGNISEAFGINPQLDFLSQQQSILWPTYTKVGAI